ncbi:hypothetical protein MAN_01786, partial [Metarhizium hybridum]
MGIQFRLILIHGVATARIQESAPSRGYSFLQTRFPDAILHEYQFPYWSHEQDYGPSDFSQQVRRILDEVAGTRKKEDMFFGTPHKALDEAPWEQYIIRLLSITDALSESAVPLLQQLPQALEDIRTDFSTLSHYFRIVNFLQRNGIGSTRPASTVGSMGPFTYKRKLTLVATQPPIKALPNSLDWVVKHKSYIDWVEEPRASILHITGSSGSGTTVIASHILQMLLQKPDSERAVVLSFLTNKTSEPGP